MDFYLKRVAPDQWNLFCDEVGFPVVVVFKERGQSYGQHILEFFPAQRAEHYYAEPDLKAAMVKAKELMKIESLIDRMTK